MQFQRIVRLTLSALILLVLLLDTTEIYRYPFLAQLENWTYDARLNSLRPNSIDNRIVIVDINENSLAEVGRWPWARDKLATLVDNLFNHYEVAVVGFDTVFAERDESSGLVAFEGLASGELNKDFQYRKAFEKIRPSLEYDRIFAASLEGRSVVMGYYFRPSVPEDENGKTGLLPAPVSIMDDQWGERLSIKSPAGFTANLEILQSVRRFRWLF